MRRRAGMGPRDRMPETYLGLQYDGATYGAAERFVTRMHQDSGAERLGQLWKAVEAIPKADELAEPPRWLQRMAGIGSASVDVVRAVR
jgi:uncharacterized protein (DUF2342 family)